MHQFRQGEFTDFQQHHNSYKKNTKSFWSGSDSLEQFTKNCSDAKLRELLGNLGWLDPEIISYSYNSHGFREREFDDSPSGLALGCSHTEGVGLPEQCTWPKVLSTLTGMKVWNLGVGGFSIDGCYRLLRYWLPRLNVKFVVLSKPASSRVETFFCGRPYTMMANFIPEHLIDFYQIWTSDPANEKLQEEKNLYAMNYICQQQNVPLLVLDHNAANPTSGQARDLMHYGVMDNKKFAEIAYQKLQEILDDFR